jgi:flagellar motor switch protein FliN/FliY
MPESQDDIDALLAEVSELADEAVNDVVGDQQEEQHEGSSENNAAPASDTSKSNPKSSGSKPVASNPPPAANCSGQVKQILSLEVPVIVRLAERIMMLSDVLNLSSGSIIEFEKSSDSELDLMINNKCIGKGHAVKVGENFGLRISHIGSVQDRIKAMGGQENQ